jgi:hypothetical protein
MHVNLWKVYHMDVVPLASSLNPLRSKELQLDRRLHLYSSVHKDICFATESVCEPPSPSTVECAEPGLAGARSGYEAKACLGRETSRTKPKGHEHGNALRPQ